ncbi:DUF2786 domain-containing protein [Modestobacter sp. URMC 112]
MTRRPPSTVGEAVHRSGVAARRSGARPACCPTPGPAAPRPQEDPIADDPLPLLLVAGSRLAAQPGVLAAELDPLVHRLVRLDPGVDTAGHAGRALAGALPPLWESGWQPADVVHVVRRRTSRRGARLVAAVVRADAAASGATERAPAAWAAQLATQLADGTGAAPADDPVGRWWRSERGDAVDGWRDVLRVLGVVRELPPLEVLLPPPSSWSAGFRTVPADGEGADARTLARIRALLAKAESTDFPEEAEALSAKAQSLMARHSIDAAVLGQRSGPAGTSVLARRVHLDDPHVEAKAAVVQAVGSANGVRVVLHPALGLVTLVGAAEDLDLVELLATSLLVQAGRAMSVAAGTGGARARSTAFRRGFLYAFAQRIGERLEAARAQATAEATAAYGSSLAPALAERARAVDTAVGELFPHLRRRGSRVVDPAGWHAGRRAADDAELGAARRALPTGP